MRNLSLRKPQTTSVATIEGVTSENIAAFFEICQRDISFQGIKEKKNWFRGLILRIIS
jgi:hypothetical protein